MDGNTLWNVGFSLLPAMAFLSPRSSGKEMMVKPEMPTLAFLDPDIDRFMGNSFAF
jgi:hypothetical protein